jgi:hypothetical protein
MIVISKAGYTNRGLEEVSFQIDDDMYGKITEEMAETYITNMNTALKCDNPIYLCWEKHYMCKKMTAKDLMGFLK